MLIFLNLSHSFPFFSRLKPHIKEIVAIDGFQKASLWRRKAQDEDAADDGRVWYTVHYYVESRDALQTYYRDFAPALRADGIDRFGPKFDASRRVLELEQDEF